MDPQSWLNAFVQRNAVDLARMRGYYESALANAMKTERMKRPEGAIAGEVVAMDVRDRVLLTADNPVFKSGRFKLRRRPNRAVRMVECATGVEVAVRKVKHPLEMMQARGVGPVVVQESLLDAPGSALAEGLLPVVVWSIGMGDLLGEFRAVIIGREESLNMSPLVVLAHAEVLPLESVLPVNAPTPSDAGSEFGDMVQPRKARKDEVEGLGGPTSGA